MDMGDVMKEAMEKLHKLRHVRRESLAGGCKGALARQAPVPRKASGTGAVTYQELMESFSALLDRRAQGAGGSQDDDEDSSGDEEWDDLD